MKFIKNTIMLLIIALIISACKQQSQTKYATGDYKESITVDGRERTYLLHIPSGYSLENKYPLVLGFHGGAGNGQKFAGHIKFFEYADKEGFISVFPDGVEHNWNDGRGTTDAEKLGVDDVKFVRALAEHLKSKLSIDENRVYATGVSNGGKFVQRLGCELSDVFAAIGVVVGSIAVNIVPGCNPVAPVSVLSILGTDDPFTPINGGDTKNKNFPNLGDGGLVVSADENMELWAAKNGCTSALEAINLPVIADDGTWVEQRTYKSCNDNAEVVFYIVHGMGHAWPPDEAQLPRVSGPTSKNMDATKVILDFFSVHSK